MQKIENKKRKVYQLSRKSFIYLVITIIGNKIAYQKWLFPKGIRYHYKNGLRTASICNTYSFLQSLETEEYDIDRGGLPSVTQGKLLVVFNKS